MSIPSSRIRENLHALSAPENQPKTLPVIEPVGAIAAQRGVAEFEVAQSGGGGGGIASPLTEQDFEARTYYKGSNILSTDYLLGLEIQPLKDVHMTDADGAEVKLTFADPGYV